MQRIFPADWKGGSPRLSAKVSANGPISRGGNDRSCKESKVLGRLKMLVTFRRKEAGHAEAHWRDMRLIFQKNDCTLWCCKILCWKIHSLYSKIYLDMYFLFGKLELCHSSSVLTLQPYPDFPSSTCPVAFHQRLDTVAKGEWGEGFGQQHRHTSQAGTRKPRESADNQPWCWLIRYWPPQFV